MKLKITANGHPNDVVIDKSTGEYKVTIDGQIYKCVFKENGLYINGELFPIDVDGDLGEGATVKSNSHQMQVKVEQVREIEEIVLEPTENGNNGGGSKVVEAPMPGKVITVKVKVGDEVKQNQVVVILEAMKMENEIMSETAGKVKEIKVRPGEAVESNQALVVLE